MKIQINYIKIGKEEKEQRSNRLKSVLKNGILRTIKKRNESEKIDIKGATSKSGLKD